MNKKNLSVREYYQDFYLKDCKIFWDTHGPINDNFSFIDIFPIESLNLYHNFTLFILVNYELLLINIFLKHSKFQNLFDLIIDSRIRDNLIQVPVLNIYYFINEGSYLILKKYQEYNDYLRDVMKLPEITNDTIFEADVYFRDIIKKTLKSNPQLNITWEDFIDEFNKSPLIVRELQNFNYKTIKPRNEFTALVDFAARRGGFCYRIACTTCGHSEMRLAFSKIIRGVHPDFDDFMEKDIWDELRIFNDFKNYFYIGGLNSKQMEAQNKLARIVAESRISDLKRLGKFPDWLGYIGLVIYHLGGNDEAIKIVSRSLFKQFSEDIKEDNYLKFELTSKYNNDFELNLSDLSKLEAYYIEEERLFRN